VDNKTVDPSVKTKSESVIEELLSKTKDQMYKGDFKAAVQTASNILRETPDNIDGLYMLAVSQRHHKQYQASQKSLDKLRSLEPEFGRAFQEQGHLFRDLGQEANALNAYIQATQFNPALIASWRAQHKIYNDLYRAGDALRVQTQIDYITNLPQELLAVLNYTHEGKLLKAEKLCRHFMQNNKRHVDGMRMLADLARRFGVLSDAGFLLEMAVEFEPEHIQARLDYIEVLRKQQKFDLAHQQADYLYKKSPENPLFQSHMAINHMQSGDFETAIALFDEVLEKVPNDPATLTSKGHALKTYGQQDAAIESYRAAFAAKPDHGDAYYGLANLKTYRFSEAEMTAMLAQEDSLHLSHHNRANMCFSLAKGYEDNEDYGRAFEFYEKGNALKCQQASYKSDQMTADLQAQIQHCTASLFNQNKGANGQGIGCQAADPIFIVGLPRAGSTLLEQIIASHSQVDGTQELPNILAISRRLRGRQGDKQVYPANLHDLDDETLQKLGQTYIDDTRYHRGDAPFFIDKMPNNFRHIALIKLILPNAKIIDARRHPMACCFSGFKQLFAEGQEFTYGLEQVGTYYKDYIELMDHWDEVLPGQILRVQYEDVVADTETQVRRVLDYLGLDFEQSCLDFYKTKRSVRTASSEQVRQPIFKSGLEQWRHFEPWLNPLKEALGEDVLKRYPIKSIS